MDITHEILEALTRRYVGLGLDYSTAVDTALCRLLYPLDIRLQGFERFSMRARLHNAARSLKERSETVGPYAFNQENREATSSLGANR